MSALNDTIFILITVFVFGIVAATLGLTIEKFTGAIQDSDVSQTAKDNISDFDSQWGGAMDWLFIAILIGLPLASMGLAFFNQIPSIFFYITIATMILVLFIGWGLQAGYEDFQAQGGELAEYTAEQMPRTNAILENFGIYTIIIALIISFGTYIRTTNSTGGF